MNDDFSALVSQVEAEFGLAARTVTKLGGEVDFNLRAECTDGRVHLIKCTEVQPGIDISWQWRLLEHISFTTNAFQYHECYEPSLASQRLHLLSVEV